MSLVYGSSTPKPSIIGRPATAGVVPVEENTMWIDAFTNQGPRGQIGVVAISGAYASWAGRACVCDDGAAEGFGGTIAIPANWASGTVKVYLHFLHRSATATGDVVWRSDMGPRQEQEAAGAPNDAASDRDDFTIVDVAASATDKQDELRIVEVAEFTLGADDRALIYNQERQGADGSDDFNASLYVFGVELVLQ